VERGWKADMPGVGVQKKKRRPEEEEVMVKSSMSNNLKKTISIVNR
tara:strand:- start:145 stop:282 length:138 start_codon:yes stop_codon:yes gene_type:complete